MWRKYLEANDFCHYIRCSIEAFLPSHLQKTQKCRAIDGLSHSLASTCGHMWPPSKGWMPDPIHLCLSIPPKYSVAYTIGFLKGKSAVRIHRELLPERRMTGLHFW